MEGREEHGKNVRKMKNFHFSLIKKKQKREWESQEN